MSTTNTTIHNDAGTPYCDEPAETDGQGLSFAVLLSVYAFVGVLGNILILIVYCREKSRLSHSSYIFTLAAVDLTVCSVVIPYTVAYERRVVTSEVICRGMELLRHTLVMVSSILLFVIAVERYLSVFKPWQAKKLLKAKVIIVVCFAFSLVFSIPAVFIFTVMTPPLDRIDQSPKITSESLNISFSISNTTMETWNKAPTCRKLRYCQFTKVVLGTEIWALSYQVFLTVEFYVSVLLMSILYIKVYRQIWKQVQFRKKLTARHVTPSDLSGGQSGAAKRRTDRRVGSTKARVVWNSVEDDVIRHLAGTWDKGSVNDIVEDADTETMVNRVGRQDSSSTDMDKEAGIEHSVNRVGRQDSSTIDMDREGGIEHRVNRVGRQDSSTIDMDREGDIEHRVNRVGRQDSSSVDMDKEEADTEHRVSGNNASSSGSKTGTAAAGVIWGKDCPANLDKEADRQSSENSGCSGNDKDVNLVIREKAGSWDSGTEVGRQTCENSECSDTHNDVNIVIREKADYADFSNEADIENVENSCRLDTDDDSSIRETSGSWGSGREAGRETRDACVGKSISNRTNRDGRHGYKSMNMERKPKRMVRRDSMPLAEGGEAVNVERDDVRSSKTGREAGRTERSEDVAMDDQDYRDNVGGAEQENPETTPQHRHQTLQSESTKATAHSSSQPGPFPVEKTSHAYNTSNTNGSTSNDKPDVMATNVITPSNTSPPNPTASTIRVTSTSNHPNVSMVVIDDTTLPPNTSPAAPMMSGKQKMPPEVSVGTRQRATTTITTRSTAEQNVLAVSRSAQPMTLTTTAHTATTAAGHATVVNHGTLPQPAATTTTPIATERTGQEESPEIISNTSQLQPVTTGTAAEVTAAEPEAPTSIISNNNTQLISAPMSMTLKATTNTVASTTPALVIICSNTHPETTITKATRTAVMAASKQKSAANIGSDSHEKTTIETEDDKKASVSTSKNSLPNRTPKTAADDQKAAVSTSNDSLPNRTSKMAANDRKAAVSTRKNSLPKRTSKMAADDQKAAVSTSKNSLPNRTPKMAADDQKAAVFTSNDSLPNRTPKMAADDQKAGVSTRKNSLPNRTSKMAADDQKAAVFTSNDSLPNRTPKMAADDQKAGVSTRKNSLPNRTSKMAADDQKAAVFTSNDSLPNRTPKTAADGPQVFTSRQGGVSTGGGRPGEDIMGSDGKRPCPRLAGDGPPPRRSRRKAGTMLFVCTLVYAVTWLPFWLDVFGATHSLLFRYTFLLGHVTNPIVYSVVNAKVRADIKRLLFCQSSSVSPALR